MKGYQKLIGLGFTAIVLLYVSFIYRLEPHQVGLEWNWASGQLRVEHLPGYHFNKPWVWVARIDTRPTRVCVTSNAHAAVNCKLVAFNSQYYNEFLAVEGWWYYWWANRISFNSGYNEEYRGMRDILRGYAFSSQQYPFVTILSEFEGSN